MRRHYIEIRVYLRDDAVDVEANAEAAEHLKDILVDSMDPENYPPPIFTQDVTYEVKYSPVKEGE